MYFKKLSQLDRMKEENLLHTVLSGVPNPHFQLWSYQLATIFALPRIIDLFKASFWVFCLKSARSRMNHITVEQFSTMLASVIHHNANFVVFISLLLIFWQQKSPLSESLFRPQLLILFTPPIHKVVFVIGRRVVFNGRIGHRQLSCSSWRFRVRIAVKNFIIHHIHKSGICLVVETKSAFIL